MLWKIFALVWMLSHAVVIAAKPQALFNGKSFEGWSFDLLDPNVKADELWSIADGVLVCKGRPPGVMRTLRDDFENYELTLEWRWAPGGKAGNSGVLIHASKPRELFAWPRSIEVQLGAGNAGDFWTIGERLNVPGSTPLGRRWMKRQESAEKPPGEWNVLRIRCQKDTLKVWVNGTLMNEATDLSVSKGAICLQSEGAVVHFRNVVIKQIDP